MAIGAQPSDPMGLSRPGMADMFKKEEKVEEKVEQEVAAPEPEPVDEKDAIYLFLDSIGGPSRGQIESWKAQFGGVHLLPLNDDTVFIYRSLKRSEWNVLKAQFMSAGEAMTEDQKKEQIVAKCLLWPAIHGTEYALTEAGLVDTLYEAISVSSYFLSPQMIMNMVMRL
jgi:hypothetical protein